MIDKYFILSKDIGICMPFFYTIGEMIGIKRVEFTGKSWINGVEVVDDPKPKTIGIYSIHPTTGAREKI